MRRRPAAVFDKNAARLCHPSIEGHLLGLWHMHRHPPPSGPQARAVSDVAPFHASWVYRHAPARPHARAVSIFSRPADLQNGVDAGAPHAASCAELGGRPAQCAWAAGRAACRGRDLQVVCISVVPPRRSCLLRAIVAAAVPTAAAVADAVAANAGVFCFLGRHCTRRSCRRAHCWAGCQQPRDSEPGPPAAAYASALGAPSCSASASAVAIGTSDGAIFPSRYVSWPTPLRVAVLWGCAAAMRLTRPLFFRHHLLGCVVVAHQPTLRRQCAPRHNAAAAAARQTSARCRPAQSSVASPLSKNAG
mmetsp:Transcript_37681/g.111526  ORF Transcript_37681/g.111526 Transcript_37681/m.111526 type:complete len:305 (-) Transcript_37681:9-923(-)